MKYLRRNGADNEEHDPLSAKIIGIAIKIHQTNGPGFNESIYHRAMEIDLAEAGINFESEPSLTVKYKDRVLGTFAADMMVEKRLILEFKALENLPLISEIQVIQYLKAADLDVGLILNFGTAPLQIKRKYRNKPPSDSDLRLQEI